MARRGGQGFAARAAVCGLQCREAGGGVWRPSNLTPESGLGGVLEGRLRPGRLNRAVARSGASRNLRVGTRVRVVGVQGVGKIISRGSTLEVGGPRS